MLTTASTTFTTLADSGSVSAVMHSYVVPIVQGMCVLAAIVCVFFLVNGGMQYMTSGGDPARLASAKLVLRNALLGLVIVFAAGALTAILSHAFYQSSAPIATKLPSISTITPDKGTGGLVGVMIKAVTGLINDIVQTAAAPFLKALSYFTNSTPLITDNSSVFNLWLAIVGMTDALFILVIALLGFHIMSYATFGLDELEIKHLLPQLALVFVLINSSAFIIDGFIEISNAMIHALRAGFSTTNVWQILTVVAQQASGYGLAALLIMLGFLILAVILVIYYVGRLVTLYLGAVLSPLVFLLWLLPGFRDFAENAAKIYLTTVFVLFIHVVILALAASLFAGLIAGSPTHSADPLMAMVIGLATLLALLRTQGLLMQLSYAGMGLRSARRLGGEFMTGVSYLTTVKNGVSSRAAGIRMPRLTRYPAQAVSNLAKPNQKQGPSVNGQSRSKSAAVTSKGNKTAQNKSAKAKVAKGLKKT